MRIFKYIYATDLYTYNDNQIVKNHLHDQKIHCRELEKSGRGRARGKCTLPHGMYETKLKNVVFYM